MLEWRFDKWRFQPTDQLTADETLPVTFGHTRTAAPEPTGGNVKIASMNVLNYFPTTGAKFEASGGDCTWYDDRVGEHVTVRECEGPDGELGPRGAAEDDDLARQQEKIVSAINGLQRRRGLARGDRELRQVRRRPRRSRRHLVDALNAEAAPAPGSSCRLRRRPATRPTRT